MILARVGQSVVQISPIKLQLQLSDFLASVPSLTPITSGGISNGTQACPAAIIRNPSLAPVAPHSPPIPLPQHLPPLHLAVLAGIVLAARNVAPNTSSVTQARVRSSVVRDTYCKGIEKRRRMTISTFMLWGIRGRSRRRGGRRRGRGLSECMRARAREERDVKSS